MSEIEFTLENENVIDNNQEVKNTEKIKKEKMKEVKNTAVEEQDMFVFDTNEEVVAKSPFSPSIDINNGLSIGYLNRVYMSEAELKEGSKSIFAGMKIPKINFEFVSNAEVTKETIQRYYTFGITPIQGGTSENYMEMIKNQIVNKVIHIISVYTNDRPKLAFPNVKELTSFELNKLIDAYKVLFTTIFDFVKEHKLEHVEGQKPNNVWLKLIANKDQSRLEFPFFMGTGFIERYVAGKNPVIKVYPEKGETLKLISKNAKANVGNAIGMGDLGGIDLGNFNMDTPGF